MRIVEDRRPTLVLLENVRNLAGPPRHVHEWEVIIKSLRQAGYRVSHKAAVFSPAGIAPEHGGHPQTRDRVFIAATRIRPEEPSQTYRQREAKSTGNLPDPFEDVEPISLDKLRMDRAWDLMTDLPLIDSDDVPPGTRVSADEWRWIDHWDEWVKKRPGRCSCTRLTVTAARPRSSPPGFRSGRTCGRLTRTSASAHSSKRREWRGRSVT